MTASAVGFAAPADAKNEVVVVVGEAKLTVADVERRLAAIPAFQLERYGSTPREIRTRFVEEALVPELLYAEEARARNVAARATVWDRVRELLRQAIENQIREQIATQDRVTDAEVRAYYEQNRERFETPRRIRLWRILVADEALARRILDEAKGTGGPKRWTEHARQHSLDKATAMRDGDVGFVRPDGRTDTPRLEVPAALFAAAEKVKDGELVPEPVALDGRFAVVWRRGSLPAVNRALEQEARSIRQILARQKVESRRSELLDKLQKELVRQRDDALLQYVHVDSFGDVAARQKPGIVPRQRPRATSEPQKTERGLR
jgi:peptidyl-prolyl cis-trans isomerase C